jgi:hypothetical protein
MNVDPVLLGTPVAITCARLPRRYHLNSVSNLRTDGVIVRTEGSIVPARNGLTGAVVAPGKTGTVVAPGKTGAVVDPGKTGAVVAPGKTGAVVVPGNTGAVVDPGKTGAAVDPGKAGAVVDPGKTGAVVAPAKTGAVVKPAATGAFVAPAKVGRLEVEGMPGAVGGMEAIGMDPFSAPAVVFPELLTTEGPVGDVAFGGIADESMAEGAVVEVAFELATSEGIELMKAMTAGTFACTKCV